jgi:release factor glutamine methyltransferase
MVYEPSDDSFLFLEVLEDLNPLPESALEVGAGLGILSKFLEKKGVDVTACDIDPEAYGVESDLFNNIQGNFDLVFWNTPYLPGEGDLDTNCGEGDVIRRFLEEARDHLNPKGYVLFLISSLTPIEIEEVEDMGYKVEAVKSKKLFMERLTVWKAHPL